MSRSGDSQISMLKFINFQEKKNLHWNVHILSLLEIEPI